MAKTEECVWDPKSYFQLYYGQQNFLPDVCQWLPAKLDSLSDIFASGKIRGQTLLDIGTGPTVCNLISAARHFSDIYLSDFIESNRSALWWWLNKDPRAVDHSHLVSYVIEREQSGLSRQEHEDAMRANIKGILRSDYTLSNPLHPSIFPQFDVVSSSLALCVVPEGTVEAYETAVKNVASLLKPGGWFVYVDSLGGTRYVVGRNTLKQLPLTKEIAFSALQKAGLTVETWKAFNRSAEDVAIDPNDDSTGEFYLTATKYL